MRKALTHWFWKIEIDVALLLTMVALVLLPTTLGKAQELQVPSVYHKQAIDIALKVTGFDKIPDILVFARREVLAKDDSPLVDEGIVGRPLWRVTIANAKVKVLPGDGKTYQNPHIHAFDVLVDAETGRVFKITSLWPAATEPKEEVRALISKRRADKDFRNNERFPSGIPKDLPKVTFLQAVETASHEDSTIITHAKKIEGVYVIFIDMGTRRPAWVIFHYGFPPFRPIGPVKEVPADARTGAFNIIDAATGEWILGGKGQNVTDDYHKYMK